MTACRTRTEFLYHYMYFFYHCNMEQQNIIDDGQHESQQESYLDYTVGSGVRFINHIIDTIGFYALIFIVTMLISMILAAVDEDALYSFSETMQDGLYSTLFSLLIVFVYYFAFESITGRTLGKYITGTKVISLTGEPLNSGQLARRTLCRFIPFEAFSFIGNGIGWHDRWSDTVVVHKSFPGDFDKE